MCCCAIASMPPPEKITPDTPLRLEIAATLAFPDGSMTAAGLRREGERGRLVIEKIAGKLWPIAKMTARSGFSSLELRW